MRKVLAATVVGLAALIAPVFAQTGLSESEKLVAIYDTILRARFERARDQLTQTCPPAPPEACLALAAASWWWQIQFDPNSRHLDPSFEQSVQRAIAATERWTEREPRRAEAWFYLAASRGALAQWQLLRGERLSAARSGKAIKASLERAVSLDTDLQDAYFGLGLYHYVADVAPTALKILRWLLLLPGGDRVEGLQEMLRAREHGRLLRWEADFQLHYLYLWYEHQTERALELLRELDGRFPSNLLFLKRIAEIQSDYAPEDHQASLASWQRLLDRARSGQVEFAAIAETRARLGAADELVALMQPSRAIDVLAALVNRRSTTVYGEEALVQWRLGRAYEQLGDRDRAMRAWQTAIARAPADDQDNIRSRARAATSRLRRGRR